MRLKLLLVLTFVSVIGCGKKSSSHNSTPQGTQDVGGGNTLVSTREDVIAAVQGSNDIILSFSKYNSEHTPLPQIAYRLRATKEMEEIVKKVFFPGSTANKYDKETHYIDSYFKLSRIVLLEKGSCMSPDNKHADASVASHKMGADICVSIENLKKIPRPALLREVLSLLIHEAAHLVGLGEEEAVKLQKKVAEGLLEVETYHDVNVVTRVMRRNIKQALFLLTNARSAHKENQNNPEVYYAVGEAVSHLTTLMPGYNQPTFFRAALGKDLDRVAKSLELNKKTAVYLKRKFGGRLKAAEEKMIENFSYIDLNEEAQVPFDASKSHTEVLSLSIDWLLESRDSLLELKKVDVEAR